MLRPPNAIIESKSNDPTAAMGSSLVATIQVRPNISLRVNSVRGQPQYQEGKGADEIAHLVLQREDDWVFMHLTAMGD